MISSYTCACTTCICKYLSCIRVMSLQIYKVGMLLLLLVMVVMLLMLLLLQLVMSVLAHNHFLDLWSLPQDPALSNPLHQVPNPLLSNPPPPCLWSSSPDFFPLHPIVFLSPPASPAFPLSLPPSSPSPPPLPPSLIYLLYRLPPKWYCLVTGLDAKRQLASCEVYSFCNVQQCITCLS